MSTTVITKPKVEIAPDLLKEIKSQIHEMGQVVIHFLFSVSQQSAYGTGIRIWPTTYLFPHDSDHRSELVHAENITLYPQWQYVSPGGSKYFTLIFSGLPRDCATFDMIEQCTGGGAFVVKNITRNESDIYFVRWA